MLPCICKLGPDLSKKKFRESFYCWSEFGEFQAGEAAEKWTTVVMLTTCMPKHLLRREKNYENYKIIEDVETRR